MIGAVLVANGRALDVALIETDQTSFARRIETGRSALDVADRSAPALLDAIAATLLSFMGDRALQPFAVDVNSGVESAPGKKEAVKLQAIKQALDSM